MIVIAARCPKKNDQKILWNHQMNSMPFIGLQTFKVQLISENSLWSKIFNHLQIKVTHKNPHSCFFSSIILQKWEFWQTQFFSFELGDDQKSVNTACNNIFLHFCADTLWMSLLFWNVKFSFFLVTTLQRELPPVIDHLGWKCTSNRLKI